MAMRSYEVVETLMKSRKAIFSPNDITKRLFAVLYG
uniref:Uncharacterized protein n=1 Tax=Candidatus Methanophaga sp. ANME-1 ERB7 TaxID=2759913 RepID=A0A7G9ZDC0_9EURY|nr:hypothetical protein DKLEMCON_00036 [Methanosarcinales archaeon ANME-1 ERB7]